LQKLRSVTLSKHQGALELAEIEISDSEQLIEKYGIRIPVVKVVSSGAELGWPFNQIALSDFFNQHLT